MQDEPVALVAALKVAVGAVLTLIVAFGVSLTGAQTAAVMGVYVALAEVVTILVVRPKVTPEANLLDGGTH